MSVLYVAHGHPKFNKGGAEISAYRLFQAFRESLEWKECAFLAACSDNTMLKPGCQVMGLGENQWLVKRSFDPLLHDTDVNLNLGKHGFLKQALSDLDPKVIHIHHYVHIGLDLLYALKRWFPSAKIILTLHEYWAMCPYEGRLLKANGQLCLGPDADSCVSCLGEELRSKLAIRRLRIQRYFSEVDHFISPSYFLKQRYLEWGVNPHQISVVENMLPPLTELVTGRQSDQQRSHQALTIGYFGQVNPWKGLTLILEALVIIIKRCPELCLEIHGCSRADLEPKASPHPLFASKLRRLIQALGPEHVRLCGRYETQELPARMANVDVVVMASRWYENAPMVIQEAFMNQRPVVAPRLGGMQEKVKDGFSGLLFEPDNVDHLASILEYLYSKPEQLTIFEANIQNTTLQGKNSFQQHQAIYQKLVAQSHDSPSVVPTNLSLVNPDLLNDLSVNFEPLGANCELGFLMGNLGINRSSLFRWLFTPLAGLELVLADGLQNFFSDPTPVTDPIMASDMVVDRRTGIFFHAAELRNELEALDEDHLMQNDICRGSTFLDQKAKYLYLVEKFRASVVNPSTLHVFSDFHQELTDDAMHRIHDCLCRMGKPLGSTLLFVRSATSIEAINSVYAIGDGLQVASIKRLAPGEYANRIDLPSWLSILSQSRCI